MGLYTKLKYERKNEKDSGRCRGKMTPSGKWPILCTCTFCARVFFLTPLPWEFIYAKRRAFLFSKIRLDGEICMGDVNIHKGYRLLPSFNNPHLQYELI